MPASSRLFLPAYRSVRLPVRLPACRPVRLLVRPARLCDLSLRPAAVSAEIAAVPCAGITGTAQKTPSTPIPTPSDRPAAQELLRQTVGVGSQGNGAVPVTLAALGVLYYGDVTL